MHVTVVGGEGQLGRAFRAEFEQQAGTRISSWDMPDFDMTDPSISDLLARSEPDLVINAGAWTDVDGAEANPEAAYAANALGPKLIADGCRRCSAPLVQISTNEVFAGVPGAFYHEYDVPNPGGAYARSKLAGERAVQFTLKAHYIVRVAWLYGKGGNHFPAKIVAAADRLGALRVVDDEFGNPTHAMDVARMVRKLAETGRFGVYHLVNEGYASRYEFAAAVLRGTGRGDIPIERVSAADWPRPATPPPHAVLVNQAAAALGIRLPAWDAALEEYLAIDAARFQRSG